MATYKTPGVFIEEISTLGSSIAGVPTAITGFVGYTEQAILLDGTIATGIPVRITSLLEFQKIFGGPFKEKFEATLTGNVFGTTTIAVKPISFTSPDRLSSFILFYQVQMFYANGGGTCYIVSVGDYAATVSATALNAGVDTYEQIDEVTLLVVPEVVLLSNSPTKNRKVVYDNMAKQCAKLQDRFAVLDVVHVGANTIFQDATDFRDNNIGADNLKYAASYYPALNTPIGYFYNDADVKITDSRLSGPYTTPTDSLVNIKTTSVGATQASTATIVPTAGAQFSLGSTFIIDIVPLLITKTFTPGTEYVAGTTLIDSVSGLVNAINSDPIISLYVRASLVTSTTFKITSRLYGTVGNSYVCTGLLRLAGSYIFSSGSGSGADTALYNRITTELSKNTLTLYPSAAMAGVYARVDADRGVWKAPANVGLALVNEPSINITDEDQENLNVDSVSGKSINAIRNFTGRGTLVWGARTLAGNDNEWRYINVRRLFTYVEESSKKASEFVVFESNTANTWQRVKGMIEAFLTSLWRDGALAGATTKDAFFVRVGLGVTMTAQDILEGKMIVEIGMAAVRPAEFIILRFEHKLQES
jgi:uncharacterized protein